MDPTLKQESTGTSNCLPLFEPIKPSGLRDGAESSSAGSYPLRVVVSAEFFQKIYSHYSDPTGGGKIELVVAKPGEQVSDLRHLMRVVMAKKGVPEPTTSGPLDVETQDLLSMHATAIKKQLNLLAEIEALIPHGKFPQRLQSMRECLLMMLEGIANNKDPDTNDPAHIRLGIASLQASSVKLRDLRDKLNDDN